MDCISIFPCCVIQTCNKSWRSWRGVAGMVQNDVTLMKRFSQLLFSCRWLYCILFSCRMWRKLNCAFLLPNLTSKLLNFARMHRLIVLSVTMETQWHHSIPLSPVFVRMWDDQVFSIKVYRYSNPYTLYSFIIESCYYWWCTKIQPSEYYWIKLKKPNKHKQIYTRKRSGTNIASHCSNLPMAAGKCATINSLHSNTPPWVISINVFQSLW